MLQSQRTNAKHRAPERTHIQIMKKTTNGCPLKLDLYVPSYMESQYSLFQICSDCHKLVPTTFKIDSCRCLGEQKHRQGEAPKTYNKCHRKKYQQLSQICSQRRVPQSHLFMFVRVLIPGWSPRPPLPWNLRLTVTASAIRLMP